MALERLRTRLEDVDEATLTLRRARRLIGGTVIVITLAGGVAGRLLDPHDFPSLGAALWWSLQTVTTVGYGDVVPVTPVGRIVGAVLMVAGIGFITVITAVVTSMFAQAAARRLMRDDPTAAELRELRASVDSLRKQLESRPEG
jgi:voltage-gated potassium channel